MTGVFDGNDGNDGNSANSGGAGNATSISKGWFFADRVDLPFVTALTLDRRQFPARQSVTWPSPPTFRAIRRGTGRRSGSSGWH